MTTNPPDPMPVPIELPTFYGSVLMQGLSGDLLLQQRDDKPGIVHPGKVSAFGGGGRPGETPLACAVREVREETGIDLDPETVRLLFEVDNLFEGGVTVRAHYYFAIGIDEDRLVITEGQLYRVSPDRALALDSLTPNVRRAITQFLEMKP